jgi:UDP-N-acetylmuramoyl-tripeptide--D-alanyl-D-alanine ligase
VFEIGMNHAGEITPLTRLVRPHVAIVTNVLPVHLGQFPNEEAIADAKAEIFLGLEPAGVAILNRDNRHFYLLERRAQDAGGRVVSFGRTPSAQVRATAMEPGPKGTQVTAALSNGTVRYTVGAPGLHLAGNSLAVAATLDMLGVAPESLAVLAEVAAPQGRGARTTFAVDGGSVLLIDESYNANPASMRAALAALATVPREAFARRIAVMGDMLELGTAAGEFHQGLKDAVDAAGVDQVFACGPNMRLLFDALPARVQAGWSQTSGELAESVAAALRAGDAVMIKGSLGTRMAPIVEAVKARLAAAGKTV